MREVLPDILAAHARGEPVAIATVVRTWNSAPRPPGASMLVTAQGGVVGSVSGGCVEGDLYELGLEVLATGEPALASFGIRDEDAFAAGLSCGGRLEVFVQRVSPENWPELSAIAASLHGSEPVRWPPWCAGPHTSGGTWWCAGAASRGRWGRAAWTTRSAPMCATCSPPAPRRCWPTGPRESGSGRRSTCSSRPTRRRRTSSSSARPTWPTPSAARLGRSATASPWSMRAVFATRERLPDADDVVVDWPHRWLEAHAVDQGTAICVLTHDPKFDVPALAAAVRTPRRSSAPWALGAPRPTVSCGSGRPASPTTRSPASMRPSGWTSGPGRRRRSPCRLPPSWCR